MVARRDSGVAQDGNLKEGVEHMAADHLANDAAEPQKGQTGGADTARSGDELRSAFYILALATLVVSVLTLASDFLAPMALAILLWFLVNAIANGIRSLPLCSFIPGGLARAIAAVGLLTGAYLVGRLVVANISELSDGMSELEPKLNEALRAAAGLIGVDREFDVSNELQALQLEGLLRGVFDIVTNTAGDISVVLLFVLFLMLDQRYFDAKIRALFPKDGRADRVEQVLADIGRDTRLYVWIMTVVSLAVGLSTYVICSYFGLKGAAFWGFLAFALNYIPTIGTFIGVVLPALFGLVQFDNYADMLGMIGALAVVQFFLGNILLPRMTGEQLNLSEFVVILSLLVWGAMWGIAGMFLAVPLMMVLAIVLAQFESTRPVAILLSKTGKIGSPR